MSDKRSGDGFSRATAVAHPNIALSKYWGKRRGPGNFPAVPSLSVTLSGMATRTVVRFHDRLAHDLFSLDGISTVGEQRDRVVAMLDRVRKASGERRYAEVESTNDFPTASGLASSASGFAALALAATHAAGLDWSVEQVSDLARRSSASAARSLYGGFTELEAGAEHGDEAVLLGARSIQPNTNMDLSVLVCVVTDAKKATTSTHAMVSTAAESPYYTTWLNEAPRIHARLRDALLAGDFDTVGRMTEASTLAMHACALAAGILYWNGTTIDTFNAVRALRRPERYAYATMDAGPHVKVFVRTNDAEATAQVLRAVPGVLRVLVTQPGEAAYLVSEDHL